MLECWRWWRHVGGVGGGDGDGCRVGGVGVRGSGGSSSSNRITASGHVAQYNPESKIYTNPRNIVQKSMFVSYTLCVAQIYYHNKQCCYHPIHRKTHKKKFTFPSMVWSGITVTPHINTQKNTKKKRTQPSTTSIRPAATRTRCTAHVQKHTSGYHTDVRTVNNLPPAPPHRRLKATNHYYTSSHAKKVLALPKHIREPRTI